MLSIKRFDWTLPMMAIALCSYFVAQSVTTYVGGILEGLPASVAMPSAKPLTAPVSEEEKVESTGDEYQDIVDRNIFNAASISTQVQDPATQTTPEQIGELGPAVKTTLDVKLLGTLVVGDGTDRRSSATIASKGGGKSSSKSGAEVYFPGDEKTFDANVKLTRVGMKQIEFINNGRLEFAELEDFAAAKKTIFASRDEVFGKEASKSSDKETDEKPAPAVAEGGKITLDQAEIDEALQNLDKFYSEVRIVPNFKGGKSAGMKVLSIKPGSIVSKLGIRRGDVLEKVNGQDLDIKQGMELFSQMKDMKNFSLDVIRGGKNQTLEYEIR